MLLLVSCDDNQGTNYAPFFWGEEELTYEVFSDPIDLTEIVTLHDSEDGDITVVDSMIDIALLDFDIVGNYNIAYSFTDSGGLSTTHILLINIIDTEAPELALTGDDFIKIVEGEDFVLPSIDLSPLGRCFDFPLENS